jgi:hypothetical protein
MPYGATEGSLGQSFRTALFFLPLLAYGGSITTIEPPLFRPHSARRSRGCTDPYRPLVAMLLYENRSSCDCSSRSNLEAAFTTLRRRRAS